MSFPITMNTNGLIAPLGVTPLPINTNGHLCFSVAAVDPSDPAGARGDPYMQQILDDDKIILELIMKFMEKIIRVIS